MHDRTAANFCCVPQGRHKSAGSRGYKSRIQPKSLSLRIGNNVSDVASRATARFEARGVEVPQGVGHERGDGGEDRPPRPVVSRTTSRLQESRRTYYESTPSELPSHLRPPRISTGNWRVCCCDPVCLQSRGKGCAEPERFSELPPWRARSRAAREVLEP